MAHDLATKNSHLRKPYDVLAGLKSLLESVVSAEDFLAEEKIFKAYEKVLKTFEKDILRLDDVNELLFGEEITAYGERCTAVFDRWEKEGGGPSLSAMIAQAVKHFDLDVTSPTVKAAFVSSLLSEIPNDLQYHGNEHYRKVLFHAIRLLATHNYMPDQAVELSGDDITLLLTGACIHDLGHEGGDNACDGVYTPGLMEQKAFDMARPYLDACGISADYLGEMETIVFCTDITFFAGDNSPCVRMKKIYKYYFWDDDGEDVSLMMMGKLRRYEDNPRLVLLAMFLHEADIATSAGLSYERTIVETVAFLGERGISQAGPKTVLAFLRDQLGETMFTQAAKALFGSVMSTVIAQAEQDILQGRESFL